MVVAANTCSCCMNCRRRGCSLCAERRAWSPLRAIKACGRCCNSVHNLKNKLKHYDASHTRTLLHRILGPAQAQHLVNQGQGRSQLTHIRPGNASFNCLSAPEVYLERRFIGLIREYTLQLADPHSVLSGESFVQLDDHVLNFTSVASGIFCCGSDFVQLLMTKIFFSFTDHLCLPCYWYQSPQLFNLGWLCGHMANVLCLW